MTIATKAADAAAARRVRWAKHVGEWERSGQTQAVFCAQRGLSLSALRWWRRRLKRPGAVNAGVSFMPLGLASDRDRGGGALIEIELRSRTRLRFEGEAALQAVARLVARVK